MNTEEKRLIILGCGGHGKVIADIARLSGYTDIAFADDEKIGTVMGIPVIGRIKSAAQYNDGNTVFVIAIGNCALRRQLAERNPLPYATLIHPRAVISTETEIGAGTVVMANAVINPCAVIGRHCIINTGAIVEHDCVLADYVHISPNAALGGTVKIGANTHIGIGAAVRNNVSVCENCTVGAGAVVVKNIEESGVYVGVPGRKMR